MAITRSTSIPTEFRAGDTVSFSEIIASYSATDGWTASVILTSADGDNRRRIDSPTASGTTFNFDLSSSESAEYAPAGFWEWVLLVEDDDGSRVTVSSGALKVLQDLTAGTVEKSFARRMVAALEARIEGRIDADTESVDYQGVSVNQIPIAECERLLNRFRAEVAIENDRDRKRRGQTSRGFTSRIRLNG